MNQASIRQHQLAFPGQSDALFPEFPHHRAFNALKTIPKNLTFSQKPCNLTAAQLRRAHLPHLLTFPDSGSARLGGEPVKVAPQPICVPKKLTLSRQKHEIAVQIAFTPRKVSPSVRVSSRLDSPMAFFGLKPAQKLASDAVPKALTRGRAGLLGELACLRAIHGIQVPQNLTFGQTSCLGGFLNPLTFCPGRAHPGPRTSSLNIPARSHHLSRKASP